MSRHDHEEEHEEEQNDEGPIFADEPIVLHPRIFEGAPQDASPLNFNTVLIELDGRLIADLNWSAARARALKAIENGYALMWNIDLGFFSALSRPLSCQTQFLSFTLALEHFRDTLWKEFKSQTLGLSLYRGSADFSEGFPWDEQQSANLKQWLSNTNHANEDKRLVRLFCRDAAVEYLSLLAARLPDPLSLYLFLDGSSLQSTSLADEMCYLNPERFERFKLVLKGHRLPHAALGWENPTSQGYYGCKEMELPSFEMPAIGFCIPPLQCIDSSHFQGMEEALAALRGQEIPFKLIAESQLTAGWDGLDHLIYSPLGLSPGGKRKLQGFCAAGGRVISASDMGNFPDFENSPRADV
jgi:hypothetical protein